MADAGRLDLDWSVAGGVAFGKQKTSVAASQVARSHEITHVGVLTILGNTGKPTLLGTTVAPPINIERSEDVTVPMVDVSLGLAYTVDRFSIGAGYRWERYFDAIDGGFEKASDADRTIDGPYLKLSVGFGG